MAYSNWSPNPAAGVGLAIIVMLLITGLHGQQYKNPETSQHSPHNSNAKPTESLATVAAGELAPKQPTSDGKDRKEDESLQAQKDQSFWSMVSAFIAGLSLGVTVVGVYLVKRTLDATRAAVDEAQAGVAAALEANATMKAAGERQFQQTEESLSISRLASQAADLSAKATVAIQLPIIRLKPDTLEWGDSTMGGVHKAHCSVSNVVIANLGPTNAFPIEIKHGIRIGGPLPDVPNYVFSNDFLADYIIKPDPNTTPRRRLSGDAEIESSQWPQISRGEIDVWFYCLFVYDDFMQTRHEKGFCWRWQNVGSGMGWRPDPTPAYNRKT